MADSDQRTITVAERSDGHGGTGDVGRPVSLPVVELLTGRGFITGKSGSGKSNSASVVAEKLLDNGFGLLIVDIDGEYYGLKEEYEILHAGADDECDIQVTTDHAEKLATLALEQNVPIILDISSYLDEDKAREVLTAVARQLFAKAKKCKQPFLLLVEEIHEYIPEKGGVDECGKMLIKIGKRGRKHGLGIVGISQRPADVKKDFITQCDWLVWHRLTWNNDTKVVSRILDGAYADAVEDLADGEAFLMTDWAEAVERVQFYRKKTFDAGATPGLEDFERPDLKSVSDDLVSELKSITDERAETEDRIAELRAELDRKNSRIAELERELQDARDMSRMADQFVDALVEHVDGPNPGRTEQAKLRDSHARKQSQDADDTDDGQATFGPDSPTDDVTADGSGTATPDGAGGNGTEATVADAFESFGDFVPAEASVDSTTVTDASDAPAEAGDTTAGASDNEDTATSQEVSIDEVPDFVGRLRAEVRSLEPKTQKMLSYYRDQGPASPLDAHFVAGGSGDRTHAYARNRTLRTAELIEHVGQGAYDYRLPALLEERAKRAPEDVDDADLDTYVDVIEATVDEF
ncbi:conserved hypothetical protein [Halorhabdus utahensis DSM 12940]|uniref:Uncharacterized protein n=1 Tax=Halorhabdus utahensis (strain DSM 12940 / JCM 11049 / AX-2) TaxID=519442 RepID=C7NR26_HALUD|nr:DUF87 domain-containing protein [Halorhabdus utahensis]ACV12939.1 conserved hypothetical protein [Halorhabdus utahensis DSM 12940]